MTHSLVCWSCGESLAALSLPLRRLDECPKCGHELHVCRMCVEFDTSKAKHCREPIAEEVRDKTSANFCDFFKPREGAYVAPNVAELDRARSGLDALFGAATSSPKPGVVANPAAAPAASPAADESRQRLEDLFKPRKP